MFKAATQTDLEHQKAAMKRDCDAVRAECEKLRTGGRRGCCTCCAAARAERSLLRAAELKYEIDKIQASQRLDLNLEKGRIRDELLTQNSKSIQTGASPGGLAPDALRRMC